MNDRKIKETRIEIAKKELVIDELEGLIRWRGQNQHLSYAIKSIEMEKEILELKIVAMLYESQANDIAIKELNNK